MLRTEDLDLPLRLLDAFVITSKQEPSRICTPDAMANSPIQVKGIVSGDAVAGVSHHVALHDILDWCIHYGGDKPSVWIITQYAWCGSCGVHTTGGGMSLRPPHQV